MLLILLFKKHPTMLFLLKNNIIRFLPFKYILKEKIIFTLNDVCGFYEILSLQYGIFKYHLFLSLKVFFLIASSNSQHFETRVLMPIIIEDCIFPCRKLNFWSF